MRLLGLFRWYVAFVLSTTGGDSRTGLLTGEEASRELLVQPGLVYFLRGTLDVVLQPHMPEMFLFGVKHPKAETRVPVSGLADRAHIDDVLAVFFCAQFLSGHVLGFLLLQGVLVRQVTVTDEVPPPELLVDPCVGLGVLCLNHVVEARRTDRCRVKERPDVSDIGVGK